MNIVRRVEKIFKERFAEQPLLVRSPGRVNLIGEHTDYNLGYVLPAAITKAIYFAIAPRSDRRCIVSALDMNDEYQFSLDELQFTQKRWPNYLMGVIDQFMKAHYRIGGFNCVFGGDIPIGAGLSSSAAIEAGLAFSMNTLFDLRMDNISLVKLAQKAENEFVGVQCGIMDQFINIYGKQDKVLRLDCRSMESEYYSFVRPQVSIILFDTCVSHSLASTEYNRRREECNEGAAIIKIKYPEVTSLRDVSLSMIEKSKPFMNSTIYRRCKYVVEENDRVLQACKELEKGDLKAFGTLMNQSHEGLKRDYEVSCKELDFLQTLVVDMPKVYGSRMMGGGFGGCTINLIENDGIEEISLYATKKYKNAFNLDLKTYVTTIGCGTNVIAVDKHATG